MALYTRMPDGRMADPQLYEALLAHVMRLTDPTARAGVGSDPAAQRQLATATWSYLAAAFRAGNIAPVTAPVYRAQFDAAYGTRRAADDGRPVGDGGTISRAAIDLFRRIRPGESGRGEDARVYVRLYLRSNGTAGSECLNADDSTCPFTGLYTGMTRDGSAEGCSPAGDWRCLSWNGAPLQALRILPPLVASMDLARALAARMQSMSLVGVLNGATEPNTPLIGGRTAPPLVPTGSPTYQVDEPPAFTRGVLVDPLPGAPPPAPGPDPSCSYIRTAVGGVFLDRATGVTVSLGDSDSVKAWNADHPTCLLPVPGEAPPPPGGDPACVNNYANNTARNEAASRRDFAEKWNADHPSCPVFVPPIQPPVNGPPGRGPSSAGTWLLIGAAGLGAYLLLRDKPKSRSGEDK